MVLIESLHRRPPHLARVQVGGGLAPSTSSRGSGGSRWQGSRSPPLVPTSRSRLSQSPSEPPTQQHRSWSPARGFLFFCLVNAAAAAASTGRCQASVATVCVVLAGLLQGCDCAASTAAGMPFSRAVMLTLMLTLSTALLHLCSPTSSATFHAGPMIALNGDAIPGGAVTLGVAAGRRLLGPMVPRQRMLHGAEIIAIVDL